MSEEYIAAVLRQMNEVLSRLDERTAELKVKDELITSIGIQLKQQTEENTALLKSQAELTNEISVLTNEITDLNKKISVLSDSLASAIKQNETLKEENERLKDQINKDSHNSSNPPSTDNKARKAANECNGRVKGEKKRGGQVGHKGTTLTEETAKKMIASGKFEHEVIEVGTATEGAKCKTRYVVDIKMTKVIREYHYYPDENGNYNIPDEQKSSVVTYGGGARALAVTLYSEGVVANERIKDLLVGMTGKDIPFSSGTVYNMCKDFAVRVKDNFIGIIENHLMASPIVHTDGTGESVNGKQCCIRNQSTKDYVLYSAYEKKSIKCIKSNGIFSEFKGILVHDHETALYHFGTVHAECNVHLLRYLRHNDETARNVWSQDLAKLLLEGKKSKDEGTLTDEQTAEIEKRYDEILAEGWKQHENVKAKWIITNERRLLNRLGKYKDNYLMFLHNPDIPFDNNMSERDLRKCKNRQKMSGGFRDFAGLEMYCDIMSYVETCKRQGKNVFEAVESIYRESAPQNS